jgi:hypothetical protein
MTNARRLPSFVFRQALNTVVLHYTLLFAEVTLDQLLERDDRLGRIASIGADTDLVALARSDIEQAHRGNRHLFRIGAAQVLNGHLALELANFIDEIFGRARVQSVFIRDSEDDLRHRSTPEHN